MKTKQKEVEKSSTWWCETCKSEEMTFDQMKAHIKEKHGLETAGLKAKKSMLSHVDGDTWFSYTWELLIESSAGQIKLTNATMSPRAKDDPMRFQGEAE